MIQAQNPSNLTRTQTLKAEHMTPYERKLDHSSPLPPRLPTKGFGTSSNFMWSLNSPQVAVNLDVCAFVPFPQSNFPCS